MTRLFCALAGLLLAGTSLAQPSSTGPLAPPANGPRHADSTFVAIVDCTVHPTPGASDEHATVVFRDGRIVSVLTAERVDEAHAAGHDAKGPIAAPGGPAGARVIEGKGLHVYPGFIDAYVEVDAPAPEGDAAALHWNRKVTPQRSALDGAGVDAGTAESLRKLGFATACISPRGGVFRGTSAVVSLAKAADEQSAAKPPVYREKAYQSVAFEMGGGYPSSEMGAVALIRQTFIDADWQDKAMRAGAAIAPNALDPLMPIHNHESNTKGMGKDTEWTTTWQVVFDAQDELEVLRAAKVMKEFRRDLFVVGSGTEYQRLEAITEVCKPEADEQDHSGPFTRMVPFILPLNFPKAPDVSTYAKAEAVELRDLMTWEQAPTNPRRMAKAGITFALTTAKLGNRGEFAANLKTALKYGLTEEQAIAALTTIPAQMLEVSDQVGTVEEGKRANLIVADGPIFGEKTKIRTVFIDGQAHEISSAPVDLEGRWDLAVAGQAVEDHWLAIDKDNGVTVHLKDKNSKASKVSVDASKLSLVFDHEPLDGAAGVFVISGVIEKDAAGKPAKMSGQGMKADGTAFAWTGTRRGPSIDGVWPFKFSDAEHKAPVVVVDKDGKVTVWDAPKDADGKVIELENVKIAEGVLSYDFDQSKLGKEGVTGIAKVMGTVDATKTPPMMVGAVKAPGGGEFAWTAERRGSNPFTGAWRVTKADDKEFDPKAKEGLTIDISERGVTLTFTKKKEGEEKIEKTVVRAEDVKFDEGTLTFTHDMSKLGGEGKSSDVVKIAFGRGAKEDTISGEGTVGEDAKHLYTAVRKVEEPITVATGLTMSQDEAERIKAVPEKLPLPFGPYGLMEQPKQQMVLLSHAKIWTCGPQGIIDDGEILLYNGKIVGVNKGEVARSLQAKPGEPVVIDCKGGSVTPGIIDCHSHTGISRGVNEGGQAVTSECRIADVTDPDAISWYRQLAGGVTAVNSLHGSANAIGGQSQTNKVRWGCLNPDDMHFEGAKPGVKFALGENPRQVNFGGGGRRSQGNDAPAVRYPATRMGVETLIRDRFTAAREYDRVWREYMGSAQSAQPSGSGAAAKPVDADNKPRIDTIRASIKDAEAESARIDGRIKDIDDQIAKLKAGKQTSQNQLESLNKSREQYAAMKANNTQNHDTLTGRLAELEKPAGAVATQASGSVPPRRDLELEALAEVLRGERLVHCHSYRQDEILMLCMVAKDFGFKIGTFQHALEGYKVADYIRDTTTGGASGFADWWAYKVEVQDAIPAAFPIMHDVGVNVSFNSDSDELARRLNVDAAKAVKYGGLTEEEALKFVTINPAKQLQIDSKVGSIEVGKDADLAIWNGDPLSSMSMCVATYVDGRCLFSTEQDEANRKTIAGERRRLIQKILNENKPKRDEGDSAEGDGARRGPGGFGGGGGRRRGPRPPQE